MITNISDLTSLEKYRKFKTSNIKSLILISWLIQEKSKQVRIEKKILTYVEFNHTILSRDDNNNNRSNIVESESYKNQNNQKMYFF